MLAGRRHPQIACHDIFPNITMSPLFYSGFPSYNANYSKTYSIDQKIAN